MRTTGAGPGGVWRGAIAGAIGGLAGSATMVAFNHLLAAAGVAENDRGRHHRERRIAAKPNDTDATLADEPASRKAASALAEEVTGVPLHGRWRQTGGSIVHHAFGAFAGAIYGMLAAKTPAATVGAGAPFGALVWLAGPEAGVPLSGLSRPPGEYPLARHATSLASHFVFGLTVEAVRNRLSPTRSSTPSTSDRGTTFGV